MYSPVKGFKEVKNQTINKNKLVSRSLIFLFHAATWVLQIIELDLTIFPFKAEYDLSDFNIMFTDKFF
jgi:hypothetical protein